MADFTADFLNEARERLTEAERQLSLLKKNPADQEVWIVLDDFFRFVKSAAPFAGFARTYRLAKAASAETEVFLAQKASLSMLPAILLKFQRIKKIVQSAELLKREPRESDEDLLPAEKTADDSENAPSEPEKKNISEQDDLAAQETALDEREEQLVVWAQTLAERENALNQRENILFGEERRQLTAQEKIGAVMTRLNDQEKIQADLEEHLAQTRLALQDCQDKLGEREKQRQDTVLLLDTKNRALEEMGAKISDLTRKLQEKNNLSEQREKQLKNELRRNHSEAEELKLNLETLEEFKNAVGNDYQKAAEQVKTLERECRDAAERLAREAENTDRIRREKMDLEQQHVEFNSRLVALQEELNAEREKLKRVQKTTDRLKKRDDCVRAELKAAGWPFGTEKQQKELAALARAGGGAGMGALRDLVAGVRIRTFGVVAAFLDKQLEAAGKKYNRAYDAKIDCAPVCGVDKDFLTAAEQLLAELIDNAFKYAVPPEGEPLTISFSAVEEGAFVHVTFSDNGTVFDGGVTTGAVKAEEAEETAAAFLFDPAVEPNGRQSGTWRASRSALRAGTRVEAVVDHGLRVRLSVPKRFIFDRVLLFAQGENVCALPLNAVGETVFLQESESDLKRNAETGELTFYWKGLSLPVPDFGAQSAEDIAYGIVVRVGVFAFLIPVRQIFDTELLLHLSEKASEKSPYLFPATVMESGRDVLWVDLAALTAEIKPALPRKIVALPEDAAETSRSASYLVYKSEPAVFGAVPVDSVLRVEDFSFPVQRLVNKKYFETQGTRLPLRDSCPRGGYPYAAAVLIFDNLALAINEVVDIVDIPNIDKDKNGVDCIIYRGRKVSVTDISQYQK